MNFFEAQARAQRNTGWLLLLFALAVAGLIFLTLLLLLGVSVFVNTGAVDFSPESLRQRFSAGTIVGVALFVILFVSLGSLYKTVALAGGGRNIAELLGGVQLARSSGDLTERRLLNVVEEMAIASGIPVPPVYVLEEAAINAFAAGWTPNTAVIGITRGALQDLDRDELQGVIAHEFGHIFNGDMRLNLRLVGVLHGILLLGLTGYAILRGLRHVRGGGGRGRGGGLIAGAFVLGVGLVIIGYAGHFFGQWIKSSISRQREYLADATAVRYTRNKDGIAGALKKIGGMAGGAWLAASNAPQYSHACIAEAVSGFLPGLFPTHPPLEERIRRIDPRWNGVYPRPRPPEPPPAPAPQPALSGAQMAVLGGAIAAGQLKPADIIELVGTVDEERVGAARAILAAMPAALRSAAEEPFGARAVIYGLLLDRDAAQRGEQERLLNAQEEPALVQLVQGLSAEIKALPDAARLPLLELALPTLRAMSVEQYRRFRALARALIQADRKVDFQEWVLEHFAIYQLDLAFGVRRPPPAVHALIGAVKQQAELLLSLLAHVEHAEEDRAAQAFRAAMQETGTTAFRFVPRADIRLEALNRSLEELNRLKPLLKPRILKACAVIIQFDGKVTLRGEELLRTIASCLDSPLPPLTGIMPLSQDKS